MKTTMLLLLFLSSVRGSMVRIVAESAEDVAAVRFDNEEANELARISATGAQQLSTDADIVTGGISMRQLSEVIAELNSQVAELNSRLSSQVAELKVQMVHAAWSDGVSALDVAATDSDFTQYGTGIFRGGFTDGTYGYMVPYASNGKVVRFLLSDFTTVAVLDLTATDSDLKGFAGGFTDGTYGYLVPNYDDNTGGPGKVARFLLSDFTTVQVLDLTAATNSALPGGSFTGGFTDGTYGYLVPYMHSKVGRFLLSDFSTVQVLDVGPYGFTPYSGFNSGFTDGTYGYMVPFNFYNNIGSKVARFSLSDFSTVQVLDLTATDSDLKGFQGGFTDGTYGYLVPEVFYCSTCINGGYGAKLSGKVARFSLSDFSTVQVLDLAATDSQLVGFRGGFTDGTYGYMVPNNYRKVARFALSDFSTVQVLDLTGTVGLGGNNAQFYGGFTDGTYGYMVPFNTMWTPTVPRFLVVPHTQGIGWTSSP